MFVRVPAIDSNLAIYVDRNPSKFLLILRSALLRYISLPLASDLTDLTAQAASPWTPRLARVPMWDLWDAWVLFEKWDVCCSIPWYPQIRSLYLVLSCSIVFYPDTSGYYLLMNWESTVFFRAFTQPDSSHAFFSLSLKASPISYTDYP